MSSNIGFWSVRCKWEKESHTYKNKLKTGVHISKNTLKPQNPIKVSEPFQPQQLKSAYKLNGINADDLLILKQKNMENETPNLSKDQQQQLLFMMLVQQHQQIAMMGMGKLKNPSTDRIERDMSSARFAIDTLAMLQQFTKGNLQKELEDYLTHTLSTLRLNYVDEINEHGSSDPAQDQETLES